MFTRRVANVKNTVLAVWHPGVMPAEPQPPMVTAVLEVARRQLGEVGPAALSLRAIAREVGVVPSALYRYLPGREAILTELIRTGYERLGASVRTAEGEVERSDLRGRWLTTWRVTRIWAVAHPHEYALLYGTPVLGYRAPQTTVEPATAVVLTLARIALEGAGGSGGEERELPADLRADIEGVAGAISGYGLTIAPGAQQILVLDVIDAWTTLFGAISFELFGHYVGSITAHADHLDTLAAAAADRLGLPGLPPTPER